jgi:hypothetical protein
VTDPLNEPFTHQELIDAIEGSKNNSSPGPDSITYEMMKHLPRTATNHLRELYNRVWNSGRLIPS